MAQSAEIVLTATKVPVHRDTGEDVTDPQAFYWITESATNFETLQEFKDTLRWNLQNTFGRNVNLEKFDQDCAREELYRRQQQQQQSARPTARRSLPIQFETESSAGIPLQHGDSALSLVPPPLGQLSHLGAPKELIRVNIPGVELPEFIPCILHSRHMSEPEMSRLSSELNKSLCVIFDCVAEIARNGTIESQLGTCTESKYSNPLKRKLSNLHHQVAQTVLFAPPCAFIQGVPAVETRLEALTLDWHESISHQNLIEGSKQGITRPPPPVNVLRRRPGRPPKNAKLQSRRWKEGAMGADQTP